MLQEGIQALPFVLQDFKGEIVSLKDFLERKVVIYFYSRDNSNDCTSQA